jgi:glycogen debranching enzyme
MRARTQRSASRRSGRQARPELDPFYVQASSPTADETARVLKHGETFAVFDHYGDIKPVGLGEEGVFHEGTRFLSCLVLGLGTIRPLFLSSTVREDNDLLVADLTNPDVRRDGEIVIRRGAIHIARAKFVWHATCFEKLVVKNYGLEPLHTTLTIRYDADFRDIFEVRGMERARRGTFGAPEVAADFVVLGYQGLDGITRRTRLTFEPRPAAISEREVRFDLSLLPGAETDLYVTAHCEVGDVAGSVTPFDKSLSQANSELRAEQAEWCTLQSSNAQFNDWLNRTVADMLMMVTQLPTGPYPFAGVPWFSTPFGRDGVITALECLWVNPDLAKGVLAFLADTQATDVVPEQDAEPGKILHEMRRGEMAALSEIPFGRYYGSVDATPLFVMLAAAYYERTGDLAFTRTLWPNVLRALAWIDTHGDPDRDGFVEYQRHSPKGLVQQGWKDSWDSTFHADGTLAQAPIALCEVQGYVYAAKRGAAGLAELLGDSARAAALGAQADALRERFEKAFWCDDIATYALALDGAKQPCRVRASNAGHCLFTGIARPDHAAAVAQQFLNESFYSGWGIRTLATTEARYNPMSYHDGSVWPHDNALIVQGMASYGQKAGVLQVTSGLYDASRFLDLHRLPELFCGFERRGGEGPTLYPVACAPQAWSAASPYMLVQACLGLHIDAPGRRLRLTHPVLPPFLSDLTIRNLRIADACVDLLLLRHGHDVGINILRREGQLDIITCF